MLGELAVLGGRPSFDHPVCIGAPSVGDRPRLMARLSAALDRRWLTNNGPLVQEFEARVAEIAGVPHAVAMCNATVALQVLLRALNLSGEVILPSFTFIATAHTVEWEGLTPVFADVDPITHNLDPEKVEALINPRTVAILGVHLWGRPCAVDALTATAERHRLHLIFDAAHAIGCTSRGRPLGSFGDAEVFSFHATKAVHAVEGGAVVTANGALAERLRKMRNFGFAGFDRVVSLGTNAKMHEFSAATGLCSLEDFPHVSETNRRAQDAYRAGLTGVPGIDVIRYPAGESHNHHYVVAEIHPDCPLTRDDLVQVLAAENVVARRYFFPGCHRMEPYSIRYPFWDKTLPVTNGLVQRLLVLPNGTAAEPAAVGRICDVIRAAVAAAPAVRARLRAADQSRAA
jgi:dTDP-4-amino-4,6-dideoxygalactose transaminase